jgi:signal transduction histidine kinase
VTCTKPQVNLSSVNEALQVALLEAETSARLSRRFLANISHELRTPLNSVIAYNSLLLEDETLGKTHRDYVASATTSTDALLSIIDEVCASDIHGPQRRVLLIIRLIDCADVVDCADIARQMIEYARMEEMVESSKSQNGHTDPFNHELHLRKENFPLTKLCNDLCDILTTRAATNKVISSLQLVSSCRCPHATNAEHQPG